MDRPKRARFSKERAEPMPIIGVERAVVQAGPHVRVRLASTEPGLLHSPPAHPDLLGPKVAGGASGGAGRLAGMAKTLAGLKQRAAKLLGSPGSLRSDREVHRDALPLGEAVEHA